MRSLLALLLSLFVPSSVLAASHGYQVLYDGGSVPGLRVGDRARIYIDASRLRLAYHGRGNAAVLPISAITEISSGSGARKPVAAALALGAISPQLEAMMWMNDASKPVIGITWVAGADRGAFAVRCNKGPCRLLLNDLEAATGKKAIDSSSTMVKP